MSLIRSLLHKSVGQLTRIAAVFALGGLALMAYSVVSPRPLPVILAMSLGHVVGALALLFYLLAMFLHSRGAPRLDATAGPTSTSTGPPSSPSKTEPARDPAAT